MKRLVAICALVIVSTSFARLQQASPNIADAAQITPLLEQFKVPGARAVAHDGARDGDASRRRPVRGGIPDGQAR